MWFQRKDYSPQHCLLLIIDKWKNAIGNNKVFGALLTDNSVSRHHNNTHPLAIEMYKVVNGMSPEIMNEVFKQRNPHYHLGQGILQQFSVNLIYSVYNGTEPASYLVPKICEQIPSEIQNNKSLEGFKREIKKWKTADCPCRICKIFIPDLGFVQVIP